MKAKLYISKENLKNNIDNIKKTIGNRKIIAMVKANAYGLGDITIAKLLQELKIDSFGVANVDEAKRLRTNGIKGMILVTSVILEDELKEAILNDISISLSDIQEAEKIEKISSCVGKVSRIHIKVDTGMTRLGFSPDMIKNVIEKISKFKHIRIEGIYTHLSCADSDESYTKNQIETFKEIVKNTQSIIKYKYIHILNSDGVRLYSNESQVDTHVRVGISMYGYSIGMKPTTKLTAPIIHINNVKKEVKIGYSGTAIASPGQKIAVVKLGYADGISRSLSNKFSVIVNGSICNQVGNICMDMMMINVTNTDAKIGDEAIIWDYTDDLKDLANKSHKIVYELISNIGNRVERIVQ